MGWNRIRVASVLAALVSIVSQAASAAPVVIDFDSDLAFVNLPNGYLSDDSAEVRFSDTSGSDLILLNAPITNGTNALVIGSDNDDSGLLIETDFLASAISLDIGNDNPAFLEGGESAVLTVYRDGAEVGQTSLVLNANGLLDQTIMLDGVVFDSAILRYDVNPSVGITELVDNVSLTNAIPEPTGAAVFGAGALVMGAAFRRRARRSRGLAAARG
jgi:hypothetical protein